MIGIIEGTYHDGLITLREIPKGMREGRIRIQILDENEPPVQPKFIEFGKYRGSKDPGLDDFISAEWHGEAEFDEQYGAKLRN